MSDTEPTPPTASDPEQPVAADVASDAADGNSDAPAVDGPTAGDPASDGESASAAPVGEPTATGEGVRSGQQPDAASQVRSHGRRNQMIGVAAAAAGVGLAVGLLGGAVGHALVSDHETDRGDHVQADGTDQGHLQGQGDDRNAPPGWSANGRGGADDDNGRSGDDQNGNQQGNQNRTPNDGGAHSQSGGS